MWPERDPVAGKRRWLPTLISVAVHSLLFLVVIKGVLPKFVRPTPVVMIQLPSPEPARTVPAPFYVPLEERGRGRAHVIIPPVRPIPERVETRPIEPVVIESPETSSVAQSPAGKIVPGLGTGRLWVRPLPLPPKDLAKRLQKTHEELVDSAVTAIVQAYLDSMAREPGADHVKLPDWTTTVAGTKFGLDSKNIYIAGLKIPAAVLALLPLPSGINEQKALDHNGQWIAEDLRRAAQRSTTLDEFKQAVRELRERKAYERELQKAQKENPDSSKQQ